MFTSIFEWIKDNVTWLKDFSTIVFTFVGTVITVLTYKRARITLLQPLRSEVVKKQTDLFIELLDFTNNHLDDSFRDIYFDIIKLNVEKNIVDLGFYVEENQMRKINENIQSKIVGIMPADGVTNFSTLVLPDTFKNDKDEGIEDIDYSKKIYKDLKNKEYKIELVFLTKEYKDIIDKLTMYQNNVLIPEAISKHIEKLIMIDVYNITKVIPEILEEFLKQFYDQFSINQKVGFNVEGTYNKFNRKRGSFRVEIQSLHKEINRYLKIEMEW